MKKSQAVSKKGNTGFWGMICGVLLGVFFCSFADAVTSYFNHTMRIRFFALLLLFLCILFAYIGKKSPHTLKTILIVFLLLLLAAAAICSVVWLIFCRTADYRCPELPDKAGIFADKNVMLIVPHEDDELNLLGGAIEEYKAYGSTLRVVFTTNGDSGGLGEERLKEAIRVLTDLGVPEEDIIFLGYADTMSGEDGYFYNVPDPDAKMRSAYGNTVTYAIPGHPAYNDGVEFTRRNYAQDLKNCILEYRPDTLICVDFDSHIDHRSTSMIFEGVVGELLREEPDYTPFVWKGFAYSTAYYAEQDFFASANIRSTVKLSDGDAMEDNGIYKWSERLRIPVSGQTLSHSLFNSRLHKSAGIYETQLIKYQTACMMNGDKVFWMRDTSSLLYSADISVGSESIPCLHDFRLSYDSVLQDPAEHTDGVWAYDEISAGEGITVSLEKAADISLLKLYDSPSLTDNILSASLVFDSGNVYPIGPLEPNGSATEISVDEKNVRSFVIVIGDTEGERPGLTEIEAYRTKPECGMSFIKLTDADGNFVYDYEADKTGETDFGLYAVGADSTLSDDEYIVSCSNESCSAEIINGYVHVSRPRHGETFVTVSSREGRVSDSIFVHDPSWLTRAGMEIEKTVLNVRDFVRISYKYSDVCKIASAMYNAAAKLMY